MGNFRTDFLNQMIEAIFPLKATDVDAKKKRVIIGAGKYPNKCSFKEKDEKFYTNLFQYTFAKKKTMFVDIDGNEYKDFNRQIAISNAISFLNKKGFHIQCVLYSETEKDLLARLIYQIFKKYILMMCSFEKDANDEAYKRGLNNITDRYIADIKDKGIINLIYTDVKWSVVECTGVDDSVGCLLIDNGEDWRNTYNIRHTNTNVLLNIKSSNGMNPTDRSRLELELKSDLKKKTVPFARADACCLDLFELNIDYYVPRFFCYKPELSEEDNIHISDYARLIGNKNEEKSRKIRNKLYIKAHKYLMDRYCNDIMRQYDNQLKTISSIIDKLLRTDYKKMFSDLVVPESLASGKERLESFIKENKLGYNESDLLIIYIYLLTLWIDSFCLSLKTFDFEEMYEHYKKEENKEYRNSADASLKKIKKTGTMEIFKQASESLSLFCAKHRELIDSFQEKIQIDTYISTDGLCACLVKKQYSPFDELKEEIKGFVERCNWIVSYSVECIIYDGEDKRTEIYTRKGRVGDEPDIDIKKDPKYLVIKKDNKEIGWKDNEFQIVYRLKKE